MNLFKSNFQIIIQLIFVTIFFSTSQAKIIDKFDKGNYISTYFSGILHFNDSNYEKSYKFLKSLEGLEETHYNYSSKYIYSLVNLGKYNEAINYSKKLEKKNLDNFDSNLIIGIYYFKNKKYQLAKKYFLKLQKTKSSFVLNNFLSKSLLNWSSLNELNFQNAVSEIDKMEPKFENLIDIQKVFLNCFYKNEQTELVFKNLTSNKNTDFSRYNYFHSKYLLKVGKIKKAKEIVKLSLEQNPRNLLMNQFNFNLGTNNVRNNFDCQDQSHVIAEIFYLTANALSSQLIYTYSNYYLNLAKYLNEDFYSFNTLLGENFYKMGNLNEAKKIYNTLGKHGVIFSWHAAKQNSIILVQENKKDRALKIFKNAYHKLPKKSIYHTFDYAEFLKNNEQFENSIQYYSKVIQSINKDHPLYPEVTDGRGVAYERLGDWNKAEKDLLSSLEVSPNQAYVINYLAYSWIEKGMKIEKSLEMLEKANNLKSNDPYIIDSLGWALFKLERYKKSKNYLQLAVKLMPADPIVNDHYGDVLWMNGNKIQARYYWKYVLGLKKAEDNLKKKVKKKLISGL